MQTFHSFMTSLSVLVFPPKKKTAQRGECGLTRGRESRQLSQASLSALTRSRWAPRILSRATSVKKKLDCTFQTSKAWEGQPLNKNYTYERTGLHLCRQRPTLPRNTPLFFFSLSGESFIWPHWQSVTESTRQFKKKSFRLNNFETFMTRFACEISNYLSHIFTKTFEGTRELGPCNEFTAGWGASHNERTKVFTLHLSGPS